MEIAKELILLFTGLCETLNKSNFDYCVAGGFAVAMWGPPRGTTDIDIIILVRQEEREWMTSLLGSQFKLIQSHEQDMVFGNLHIWRHVLAGENKKNLYPLDMLIASDKYLENVLRRRIEIEYKGVIVPVISIEDLIILKSISFRDIDRFDIENLINAGNPIDWDYLDGAAARLLPQKQQDFIDVRKKNGGSD